MLLDDVDHPAFDVCQAFPDQRRRDLFAADCGQSELGKLVGIGAGAGAYANRLVDQVQRRDRYHALVGFAQRLVGVVPWPGRDREAGREIHHHGPRDRHDVVAQAVVGRHQHHRAGFDQREGLVKRHGLHVVSSNFNWQGTARAALVRIGRRPVSATPPDTGSTARSLGRAPRQRGRRRPGRGHRAGTGR